MFLIQGYIEMYNLEVELVPTSFKTNNMTDRQMK